MKIKGAIIIYVKFTGARKLTILWCFMILHVQILSGFENWDIQDLTLRRYNTIISLNFPELFIIEKYVKIRFKNRETTMLFSRGQKIENITKTEQRKLFS